MCRPIRPRRLIAREESVGLFDQAKISQRSEADIGAVDGPVHCATRREHPRHARKALFVLDARETISLYLVKGGRKGINEEGGRKDINEINEEHIEQEGGRAQREGAAGVRNCPRRRRWAGGVSTVFVCAGRNASSEGTPTRSQAVNTLSLSLYLSLSFSLAVVDL